MCHLFAPHSCSCGLTRWYIILPSSCHTISSEISSSLISTLTYTVSNIHTSLALTSPELQFWIPNSSFYMGALLLDQMQLDLNETCNPFPQPVPLNSLMCIYYIDFFLPVRLPTWHPSMSSLRLFPDSHFFILSFCLILILLFLIPPPSSFLPWSLAHPSLDCCNCFQNGLPDFSLHHDVNLPNWLFKKLLCSC